LKLFLSPLFFLALHPHPAPSSHSS
jgi:hypothetical protein